jgi:hypothetical protein
MEIELGTGGHGEEGNRIGLAGVVGRGFALVYSKSP